jgi:mannose-1-phosphate guanylyltransferase
MASLTNALYGQDLPKQFAALDSDRTLLQGTMDRVGRLIPPRRTVVVVSAAHEHIAAEQLAEYPGVEIVVQPRNLGTGPGILLPLAHILVRDPEADVAVFPSDHHIRRNEPFIEALEHALMVAPRSESGVVLLGAAAERPASDLGWIVRGRRLGNALDRAWQVDRFVEKPSESVAMALLGSGSLWNTMVIAGRGRSLWEMGRRHLPRQAAAFEQYQTFIGQPEARQMRERLYQQMHPACFSREVLQAAEGLAVVPLIDAGWFDCGTPERLFDWLRTTPEMEPLLRRLQQAIAHSNGGKSATPAHAAA